MAIQCPKCRLDNPEGTLYCEKCGEELSAPEEIQPSRTETYIHPKQDLTTGSAFAGRYQIIEELGKGGMGKVYKAFDKEVQAKVALKLIKPEIAADKDTIDRFRNELKVARDISHKNICRMYDLGRDGGNYYITMEYVPGEDLKNMIRMSGQLGVGTAVNIAKQVCEGLSEAHKLGVVHRDLKPSNIMIDRNGNVRIMDFGIARSIKGKGITGAGVMIGTPEYMSPEQVEGKDLDQRSDIYSLGVILFEMLTGRAPFEGDTPFIVGVKHKSEIPKNPKEFNAHIPEDLSRLILKCLEKTKATRFQSADELRSDIEKIEKGIPTAERAIPQMKPLTSKEITVKFSLKKLLIPSVIVIAAVILGVSIWRFLPRKEAAPAKPGKQSIAVLPFEDLSPSKDQEYLCNGMAETLINALTKIKNLWVPARTSSFSFKGKNLSIQEIGRQLGVDNLLESSVQVIGNKLRITANLIQVKTGSHVWSQAYDRQLKDVFAIQDEIAQAIVKALKITLLGEKEASLVKNYTHSLEAYNLYLQGRYFWYKRTDEGMLESAKYFDRAIDIDPAYALAYAGLADTYITLGQWRVAPPKSVYPKAKQAAIKALEIDEGLGEAHASLAMIKRDFEWDWPGSDEEFKRAIELNPNYSVAHQWYSEYLVTVGRFEQAIAEVKRAQELDPLSLVNYIAAAIVFRMARQFDLALAECQKAIDLDPNYGPAYLYRGYSYMSKGIHEKAVLDIKKYLALSRPSPNFQSKLAVSYALAGNKNEALKILGDLMKRADKDYISPMALVDIYQALGAKDEAFLWLDKAIEERAYGIIYLKTSPDYDALRSDPRFDKLLRKIGLEK